MKWIGRELTQRRRIVSLVLLLSATGLPAWFGMIRQEDPAFPYRYGYVLGTFPGPTWSRSITGTTCIIKSGKNSKTRIVISGGVAIKCSGSES